MRNLIVCCDGTWNTRQQEQYGVPTPTNVVRLFNAACEGPNQLRYYHSGVGTKGGFFKRLLGGAFGDGLPKNIKSAYRWLAANYLSGDRIFLFGFSRGAFTARSLGGMICRSRLLDLRDLRNDNETWKRVDAAFNAYRRRLEPAQWATDWLFHKAPDGSNEVPVHFVGVWDTVGALGVPNDLALLNLFDDPGSYAFHDTKLNPKVLHARHAVALDELRGSFAPTLWTGVDTHPDVKQVWFPGVHSDVGGGYLEKGLSDAALQWMIEEAKKCGLEVDQNLTEQIAPNFRDVLHDSASGVFKELRTQPRNVPLLESSPEIHPSAIDRLSGPPIAQTPYRKSIRLGFGDKQVVPIYARDRWGETRIFLEKGARYRLTAEGQWVDSHLRCGPGGMRGVSFGLGRILQGLGTLLGKLEMIFRKIARNKQADFWGTKRVENEPWFALIGVVMNGGNPDLGGTPGQPEQIVIKEGCDYTCHKQSGYLYCFANDAWHFYGNNRGSVKLTVERLS